MVRAHSPLLSAGSLYSILSPTNWLQLTLPVCGCHRMPFHWMGYIIVWHPPASCGRHIFHWMGYIIVWHPPASCGRHIFTQINLSTVKVIPWYLRPDAPVIHTSAFLIWQLSRGSTCYNHPVIIFQNSICGIFLHVRPHPTHTHI